jgi:hypothetical protein
MNRCLRIQGSFYVFTQLVGTKTIIVRCLVFSGVQALVVPGSESDYIRSKTKQISPPCLRDL